MIPWYFIITTTENIFMFHSTMTFLLLPLCYEILILFRFCFGFISRFPPPLKIRDSIFLVEDSKLHFKTFSITNLLRYIMWEIFAEINNFRLAHLISRSSVCSDNHRERGKVLERHKSAGMLCQPWMKINKTKTFNTCTWMYIYLLMYLNVFVLVIFIHGWHSIPANLCRSKIFLLSLWLSEHTLERLIR